MGSAMKATDILAALEAKYPAHQGWLTLREFEVAGDLLNGYYREHSRLDLFALSRWESRKFRRIAFEVKVSRSDWLHELARPRKRQNAVNWSGQFYFAAPVGLVKPGELPEGVGLIEVSEDGRVTYVTRAPMRPGRDPDWRFVGEFGYQIARQARWEREAQP